MKAHFSLVWPQYSMGKTTINPPFSFVWTRFWSLQPCIYPHHACDPNGMGYAGNESTLFTGASPNAVWDMLLWIRYFYGFGPDVAVAITPHFSFV